MDVMALEPRLKAEDLIDSLGRENEQGKDRKIEVRTDGKLEELVIEFEEVLANKRIKNFYSEKVYKRRTLSSLKYSSKDIEKFSLLLERYHDLRYFDERVGLFLSSLINYSEDKDFVLHTYSLTNDPEYIGYLNFKNITVKGNAGDWLGYEMKKGKIIVEGDLGHDGGYFMRGGLIEIKGNAGEGIGYFMESGKIIVRGNADRTAGGFMSGGKIIVERNVGKNVGHEMEGGKIHINGDYESISKSISGGDIYHKGKQIIKDGKAVRGAKIKWA